MERCITLYPPMLITPRLMAGVKVPGGYLSVERKGTRDYVGRPIWRYAIDVDGWSHEGADLSTWGDERGAMGALLSFLCASGEARDYAVRTGRESENGDLFPPHVAEWADMNADEIEMIRADLEGEDADG